jgi:hypothetical protein
MTRTVLGVLAFAPLIVAQPIAQQSPVRDVQSLVGTWMLVSELRGADTDTATPVHGARGLAVFDAAGHVFELVARTDQPILPGMSEARSRFYDLSGSWGRYQADMDEGRITYRAFAGRSPNVTDREFSRTFELAGDRLTITSQPGELHTRGVTRWTWQHVPPLAGLSDEALGVVGFWRHEVEGQKDAATGEILTERRRDPSVIVYTTAGFAGVHFPTLDRQLFASDEPTDAEAREEDGYLGYYAALGVYPGMVFHNVLGGGFGAGTTFRRFFEVRGDELHLTFPPGTNREGRRTSTYVRLRRLSDADDMLDR